MKANRYEQRSGTAGELSLGAACMATCRKVVAQIQSVKYSIAREFGGSVAEQKHLLQLAVNEAEALAWQTGFPQLFFPTLAVEKAHGVVNWHARQQSLRRGRTPLARAA